MFGSIPFSQVTYFDTIPFSQLMYFAATPSSQLARVNGLFSLLTFLVLYNLVNKGSLAEGEGSVQLTSLY
jgi:hypothetical protein